MLFVMLFVMCPQFGELLLGMIMQLLLQSDLHRLLREHPDELLADVTLSLEADATGDKLLAAEARSRLVRM